MSAHYFVSGVWKEKNKISSVMLHANKDNVFEPGQKTSLSYVIKLVKSGLTVMAIKWDYQRAQWKIGAPLEVYASDSEEFLQCRYYPEGDKLEHLIDMQALGNHHMFSSLIKRRKVTGDHEDGKDNAVPSANT